MPQCGNRYPDAVIDKGPEKVLFYLPHSSFREFYTRKHIPYIILYQDEAACLLRHIRTAPYGYADVSLRQRWRVVYAIAHHSHGLALGLKLLYYPGLLARQHIGYDFLYPSEPCDGIRRSFVVAGEHDYLEAFFLEGGNR